MEKEKYQDIYCTAQAVLQQVDGTLESLQSARSASRMDFLFGLFASYIKRQRIKEANLKLRRLRILLEDLNAQSEELSLAIPETLSDTFYDFLVDVIFDNSVTELRVHEEILDKIKDLEKLREELVKILAKIKLLLEDE